MANEKNTEILVREMLFEQGYYNDPNVIVEEQSSKNPKIDKLLKFASKNGKGKGYPEFIIQFRNSPQIILIECKANVSKHESPKRDKYKDYAVDGVLLYANYLKDDFNVIAIAVSGENQKERKISNFLWLKGHYTYKDLQDKNFLSLNDIASIITKQSLPITEEKLNEKAMDYNSFLHENSIPEVERCTLISAILVALEDEPFLQSYLSYSNNHDLIFNLIGACERVLKSNHLGYQKIDVIIGEYSKFKNNSDFSSEIKYDKKTKKQEKNTILRDFISKIREDILPYIGHSQFDVLGKFYTQFIRYAGSDKKTGLVLTPFHITDFFCEIAELSQNDTVFDPCCGTGGFLVSAMNYMINQSGNNTDRHTKIKSDQLIGIEKRSDMFAHACSNMMMRGDGKSHIFYGSCFDEKLKEQVKSLKPTRGFLNPPYQDGNADEQLEFIENTLECLEKDGICVAICQMSTVVSDKNSVKLLKQRLLEKHTLKAVFSMPNDLFHPVGVVTSILVFQAYNPHNKDNPVFFGYFKDDGFIKSKDQGRIDKNKKWMGIKKRWLDTYKTLKEIPGLSIMQQISYEDEWCAEAYMETDYSSFTKDIFEKNIKQYVAFNMLNYDIEVTKNNCSDLKMSIDTKSWKYFNLNHLFNVSSSKTTPLETLKEYGTGKYPYVSTQSTNNGTRGFYAYYTEEGNVLTVDSAITGYCSYQAYQFSASDHVEKLIPKFQMNKWIALFLSTIINLEHHRFSYGRKASQTRLKKLSIKLPVDKENNPDWEFMENYIKTLPYSLSL
ncbi:hypothetical protein BKH42_03565 [Helicobacter sp. 13S00482-2]|uniref:N-6 DNA methylase n=1 Tax=Helicobacter sp. 13S00482-2 TaxID=1476200 RepID=UPI000BA6C74F|nr:N-6 DNA methylase [Helicobacter sp. 13S00482-2]PAF53819.1 hypothetical protein BKH42_03565 [Helicobacter sp. 13S00482-2]